MNNVGSQFRPEMILAIVLCMKTIPPKLLAGSKIVDQIVEI